MLETTFLHIPGIGPVTERRLWAEGITHWDDLRSAIHARDRLLLSSPRLRLAMERELASTVKASAEGNYAYFADKLPKSEMYRLACRLPNDTVFLDIETTGLSAVYHMVTMIGLWKNGSYSFVLNGEDAAKVKTTLETASCLVTFNGTRFDLPFLKSHYPNLIFPSAHIDLMYLARRAGLKGGQKSIEGKMGYDRPDDVKNQRGENAPALWYAYTYGDIDSGRLLVRYNECDIAGMRFILRSLIRHLTSDMPETIKKKAGAHRNLFGYSHDGTDHENRAPVQPYSGRIGPKKRMEDLTADLEKPLRIVGIDLSGSERRPSGWCLLVGSDAETTVLRSDDEILQATLDAQPDLVSIDSPLSLPMGRNGTSDDDPARRQAGITRHCERELKRRGVNVYPCLIQSMQSLTGRGISLAGTLRGMGVPVIESYPGAAQDIIGVPRKRESLPLLKRGLAAFGIRGLFVSRKVTHDELDAITAAAVGVFFWSGRFEALGNSDEDYLIVPELRTGVPGHQNIRVTGISGRISSGKTAAAQYVADKYRMEYWRYSSILSEMLSEQSRPPTRENLQELGEYVNHYLGQRWLSKRLAEQLSCQSHVVVDGLRFPEDHAFMVERFGPLFLHLHIDSDCGSRRSRYLARGFTEEEFVVANNHNVERSVDDLRELAHVSLKNECDKKSFLRRVDEVMAKRRLTALEAASDRAYADRTGTRFGEV